MGNQGYLSRLRVRTQSLFWQSPTLWTVVAQCSHLSIEPLALVRSRWRKSPWNCGSRKASRQPGILRETSQSGLSDGVCVDLRGQRLGWDATLSTSQPHARGTCWSITGSQGWGSTLGWRTFETPFAAHECTGEPWGSGAALGGWTKGPGMYCLWSGALQEP